MGKFQTEKQHAPFSNPGEPLRRRQYLLFFLDNKQLVCYQSVKKAIPGFSNHRLAK